MIAMGKRGPKPKYNDISCPNETCFFYGKAGEGNITSRGTWTNATGEEVRKFVCTHCGRTFNSRTGTAYEGTHLSTEQFDRIVRELCNGSGIRQIADSEGVNKNTVLYCQKRAGKQSAKVMESLEVDLELRSLQFDELTAVVEKRPPEQGDHFTEEGTWVWTGLHTWSRYVIGAVQSIRGEEAGHCFLTSIWAKMDDDCVPTVVTDGYKVYITELMKQFGDYVMPTYLGVGRPPTKPKWIPKKGFRYAQVIKTRKGRKMETIDYVDVVGHVPPQLMHTSYIERHNLTFRNCMSRLVRKGIRFSKKGYMLQHALDVNRAYYNFCRPHTSLYLRKEENNGISMKRTPAMVLGLSDHIWSMNELMSFLYRQNTH
ncbi:MAG: hypothetical protein ACI381_07105 [Candidatus Methanomethylophilaceae archaeon]